MGFPVIANLTYEEVVTESSVQKQPLGTLGMTQDGRLFAYAKAGAALNGLMRLRVNANHAPGVTGHTNDEGFEGALSAAASAGDTSVSWTGDDSRAVDDYKDAFIVFYGSTCFEQHRVKSGPTAAGTSITVVLEDPLLYDVSTSIGVTCYANPYKNIKSAGGAQTSFETFMGVNLIPITSAYYFWLQIGGPAIITPTGGTWPGSAANLRDVYPNPSDGTIQPATLQDPSSGYQRIGTLIAATGGTSSDYGDCWVNLQLGPW